MGRYIGLRADSDDVVVAGSCRVRVEGVHRQQTRDDAHRDREEANAYWTDRGEEPLTSQPSITGTREAGALRRRSMDLTRALAEMRKP